MFYLRVLCGYIYTSLTQSCFVNAPWSCALCLPRSCRSPNTLLVFCCIGKWGKIHFWLPVLKTCKSIWFWCLPLGILLLWFSGIKCAEACPTSSQSSWRPQINFYSGVRFNKHTGFLGPVFHLIHLIWYDSILNLPWKENQMQKLFNKIIQI